MNVLPKLAHASGRRDNLPNQKLAAELAGSENTEGIRELVNNLNNPNRDIQSDCIKTLYEIGYLKPELIAAYVKDFITLLKHRNNRMVWGGMIALGVIARLKAEEIFTHRDEVMRVMEGGSVIAVDNAVKTLAGVASVNASYHVVIFPRLLGHLQNCRPKEVALHAEFIYTAVNDRCAQEFGRVLQKRMSCLNEAQKKRVNRLLKAI